MNQSNQEKYITYEHIEEDIQEKLCQKDEKNSTFIISEIPE